MAVTNNFELDVKIKCLEADMTQQQLGEAIGSTGQYVNRVMKKDSIITKKYVEMMEALGYDITLVYTRRGVQK